MKYTFRISGETPAKKNSRIVLPNGKNIPSKIYHEWHDKACFEVTAQRARQNLMRPIDSKVEMKVHFVHGDNRKRDCDNGLSSICDLLVDCKIISDDNWKIVSSVQVSNDYDKGNAYCEVELWEKDE